MNRSLSVVRGPLPFGGGLLCACDEPRTTNDRRDGFTLIEIMVAIAIVAIILAIGIPAIARQKHQDSMRKAVQDVVEACGEARARAVLDGAVVELSVRPKDRQISVRAGAAQGGTHVFETGEHIPEQSGGGKHVFSTTLSDRIFLEEALVFQAAERELVEEVVCKFYPDGTCDQMVIRLASDLGERRTITTDVITGIAEVEVIR